MDNGKIVYLKPKWLAGIQVVGPYGETVPGAWASVFHYLESGAHFEMPERGYGLTYDDPRNTDAENLRYVAGVEVPATWLPPKGCAAMRVEFKGGSYARLRFEGPYSEVGQVISEYRNTWVPREGLQLDSDKPLLAIYHSDTRTVEPQDQVADICLPVATLVDL